MIAQFTVGDIPRSYLVGVGSGSKLWNIIGLLQYLIDYYITWLWCRLAVLCNKEKKKLQTAEGRKTTSAVLKCLLHESGIFRYSRLNFGIRLLRIYYKGILTAIQICLCNSNSSKKIPCQRQKQRYSSLWFLRLVQAVGKFWNVYSYKKIHYFGVSQNYIRQNIIRRWIPLVLTDKQVS